MPKKSQKSRIKQEAKTPVKIAWLLRYIPLTMLIIICFVAAGLNVRWWPLEFFVSFTPQLLLLLWVYLMIYTTIATWHMFINGPKLTLERIGSVSLVALGMAGLIGVYALSHSINVVSALDINDELSLSSEHLTVGTFNKLYRSQNFANDAYLITASKVDVFSLQEVDESELSFIKQEVNHEFSYITDCDCSASNTEVGLVSRYPIINAKTIYEHDNAVIARTLISSEKLGDFIVYLVHMHVPYISSAYNLRDDALDILRDSVNQETLPVFAVGDFNATVFSPDMQDFSNDSRTIKNVVARSWPQCSWFGSSLDELACARIDYVFAPAKSTVHSMEIGEEDFSDHRSVTVEVSI